MPKIGGHVSASGGLVNAFANAQNIGADCFQFFLGPPQMWVQSKQTEEGIAAFNAKALETGLGPNFIHGTYLVNLGTQGEEHLRKSIDWLIYGLSMASNLGVRGLIFHLGSHKGLGFEKVLTQVCSALGEVLEKSTPGAYLLLENSAGAGGNIGSSFADLGAILKEVNNERLKICIDTQHAFAAGYDWRTEQGLEDMLIEFDLQVGLDNLYAFHCNDSKTELKSGRDRHENIGEGFIGKDAFAYAINHPKLQEVPFILEVPGIEGNGPDKQNIDILRSMIK